jgi:formylglycine-generating enzyme required for sulfatase activity
MAGNVWEWCRSLYKPYPYRADDGREVPQAAGARVLRGGSLSFTQRYARCASRFGFNPDSFFHFNVGFRVVFSPN